MSGNLRHKHFWHHRRSARVALDAARRYKDGAAVPGYGIDHRRGAFERSVREAHRLNVAQVWFAFWFGLCALLGLAWCAFCGWAVFVVVSWLVTK